MDGIGSHFTTERVSAACNGNDPAGESPVTVFSPGMPCSYIRLRRWVTVPWESSKVKVLGGRRETSRSDWHRRASKHAGRSMKRTLKRRNRSPTGASVGGVEKPTRFTLGEGHGDLGENWRCAPEFFSRRLEDGTYGRITVPKQGRSWGQPRLGRRAKTRCIISDPGKSAGVSKTGGSGRRSKDGRDNITLPEQRPRGRRWSLEWPEAWSADNAGPCMAGRQQGGEGDVKPVRLQVYADLALKPSASLGRSSLTDEAPRLEAVLGKTRRTEF